MRKKVIIILTFSVLLTNTCTDILKYKTVAIDGINYRDGFYGNDLWSINLTFEDGIYKVGSKKYQRVKNDKFNWVHSNTGNKTEGTLYCSEAQWEQASTFYSDNNNFHYYYSIVTNFVTVEGDVVIDISANIDINKFNELITFANTNSYNPFSSNKNTEVYRLPIPDNDKSPRLIFYRESKDGYFTSSKGYLFHAIDDKLVLVFFYDMGSQEVVIVDVPENISLYFIELIKKFAIIL